MSKEGAELEHLYGSVFFREPTIEVMDQIERDEFIRELVQISRDNFPEKEITITSFDGSTYPLLQGTVERIFIENISPEKDTLWWPAYLQTGEIPDPSEALAKIIRRKNNNATSPLLAGFYPSY